MNYNDLQRVKPYYNTINSRYIDDNIPKALPLIRNNHFDHSNITVAPPIPSYYKQNINATNYYSKLPNIMNITYSSAENVAKKFSNNLQHLQNLEDQITEKNRVFNLPKLNQNEIDNNYKNQLKEGIQNKIENGNDEEDIKNKISQMREVAGRIPDYQTEEQKKLIKNKELMSEEGMNRFNMNLVSALSDYSNNIQKTIAAKNNTDTNMYDMIKKGIDSLKDDFTKRIEKFNKESKNNMEIMRKLMMNSSNPRLQLLSEHLFSTSDIDQIMQLREKSKKKNGSVIDVRRMSQIMMDAALQSKAEVEKKKKEELKALITKDIDQNKENNNIIGTNGEIIEKIPLDLWEKNRKEAITLEKAIKEKVSFHGQNFFQLQPLNKFRSYVFLVMAARRILNIRYIVYKEFKFDSVTYYLNNYEDMDIILKKLVYNTVKDPFLEILNDSELNLNLTYDNEDNHEVYYSLQEYIERIMKGFNTKFFDGLSGEMLSYLSLYVTNHCFIPKDFFTTFELVRFRTTETGEFIELDDNSRKMILTFYIFIKILLRNIFLELLFNQADRKKLSLNSKLNIKMLVSVLYRSIIKNLSKNCVTKTNLDDIEDAEDMTAFLKLRFPKREFHLHRFLKKRYFLKVTQVEDKPKRISKRAREPISPKSSVDEDDVREVRETNKKKNEKKRKKIEEIENEKKSENDNEEDEENEDEEVEEEEKNSEEEENTKSKSKKKDKSKSSSKSGSGSGDKSNSGNDNEEEDESESKNKKKEKNNKKKRKKRRIKIRKMNQRKKIKMKEVVMKKRIKVIVQKVKKVVKRVKKMKKVMIQKKKIKMKVNQNQKKRRKNQKKKRVKIMKRKMKKKMKIKMKANQNQKKRKKNQKEELHLQKVKKYPNPKRKMMLKKMNQI